MHIKDILKWFISFVEKPKIKIILQEILPGQGNAIENLIHLFSQHNNNNNNNNNVLQKHFSGVFSSTCFFHQRHLPERMQEKHGFNVEVDTNHRSEYFLMQQHGFTINTDTNCVWLKFYCDIVWDFQYV